MTLHDLALAVLVCSLSYSDGCELFNEPDLPKIFTRWHQKLTGGWPVVLGIRKPTTVDYAAKIREFSDYMRRGSDIPSYSYKADEFQAMECPTVQIVKVTLMRDLHIAESELMDRPWAVCLWDYVTLRALAGQVKMVDSNDIENARAAANALAERLNRKEANGD